MEITLLRDYPNFQIYTRKEGGYVVLPKNQLIAAGFQELNMQVNRWQGALPIKAVSGAYIWDNTVAGLKTIATFVKLSPDAFDNHAAGRSAINSLSKISNYEGENLLLTTAMLVNELIVALRVVGNDANRPPALILPLIVPSLPAASQDLKQGLPDEQGSGSKGFPWMLALIGVAVVVAIGSDGLKGLK